MLHFAWLGVGVVVGVAVNIVLHRRAAEDTAQVEGQQQQQQQQQSGK